MDKGALVTEPIRNGSTGPQTLPELGTRDIESLDALGNLIDWLVLIRAGKVGHLLEGNHLDLQFVVVLDDEVLGIVGTVEVLACRVLARTSVVTTDDEVGRTVVFADNGMPDGLTRAGHSHGERKEGKMAKAVGVLLHDRLVNTDTSVVVDISGLGKTDDGVNKNVL
jgi:hypothetical protein